MPSAPEADAEQQRAVSGLALADAEAANVRVAGYAAGRMLRQMLTFAVVLIAVGVAAVAEVDVHALSAASPAFVFVVALLNADGHFPSVA